MNKIDLSVLIITYNQENYIEKTIESIINQKHGYSYEIIIGEDCSSDRTRDVIEKLLKQYPDIIKPIFNDKNLGILKNYFNVLNHCKGKYIMECAGDDFWLPGKVEKQIEYMEEHPDIGMCYGLAKKWIETKGCYSKRLFGTKRETIDELLTGNDIPAPTVCYRNELIKRYVEEEKPLEKGWLMEDYPEWLWFARNSKIKFIKDEYAVYREIKNSACHIDNYEKQFLFNKSYYDIQEYFAKKYNHSFSKFSDEEIWFNVFYSKINENYTKENAQRLKNAYNKIGKKTIHNTIVYFVTRNKFFFTIFQFLK